MKYILIFLLLPFTLFAQLPDPKPNSYMHDYTGTLHSSEIDTINKAIYQIEQKYSVQIAVVLINELPDKYSIEDYARAIGRKWHVGNACNGLTYVAAIKDRKQRLEVAEKLEGAIPDITALHLTDHVKPYFRSQKYGEGILNLVQEINKTLVPVTQEQKQLGQDELKKKKEGISSTVIIGLFIFGLTIGMAIVFYIIYINWRRKKQERAERENQERERQFERQESKRIEAYSKLLVANDQFAKDRRAYRIDTSQQVYETENKKKKDKSDNSVTPIIPTVIPDTGSSSSGSSYSSDSSSSSSSSSDSSSYGDYGSSSSSSDSGYSGGGSSNDW